MQEQARTFQGVCDMASNTGREEDNWALRQGYGYLRESLRNSQHRVKQIRLEE